MPIKVKNVTGATSRLDRARIVRDQVLAVASTHGRWEDIGVSGTRSARVLAVDSGNGWNALVTTRFSGLPGDDEGDRYAAAALGIEVPRVFERSVDVWIDRVGKVLSIGSDDGVDILVTLVPGPWESGFGLAARSWTPAVARRLARRVGQ